METRTPEPLIPEEMLDRETGERLQTNWSTPQTFTTRRTNAETGEVEQVPISHIGPVRRKRFQISKKALQRCSHKTHLTKQNKHLVSSDLFSDSNRKPQYYYPVSIERKFFNDNQNISPFLFLVPTLLLVPFPAWFTVITIIIEISLHMWAHKINKKCKDPHLLYRSPLDILTSQFCAICKSKSFMEKIGQLQDARALKVYSRKSTYVERVSVMT